MADAKFNMTTIILDNNNYQFKATGQTLVFDGYLKVYGAYEKSEEKELPPFENYNSNVLIATDILKEQHFTKPPARYTEAKLIEEMESLGIGRPSTYAKTMDTITARNYARLVDKKFEPTEIGIETTDKLQEFFSHIINVKYTANMENALDDIAIGQKVWFELLDEFYKEFEPMVKEAFDNMEKKEPEKTGEDCPECGSPLVIRKGRYGEFISCSGFPKCKYIKGTTKQIVEVADCPKCDGKIIEKNTKKGKIFYGCNQYPKCDFALWDKPNGDKCPECDSLLVLKKDKIKCSSCDFQK
jgi:DNA topoisomerase-1